MSYDAYCITPFPMILTDLQGHSPIASLYECDFFDVCAAVNKILTDHTASRYCMY